MKKWLIVLLVPALINIIIFFVLARTVENTAIRSFIIGVAAGFMPFLQSVLLSKLQNEREY